MESHLGKRNIIDSKSPLQWRFVSSQSVFFAEELFRIYIVEVIMLVFTCCFFLQDVFYSIYFICMCILQGHCKDFFPDPWLQYMWHTHTHLHSSIAVMDESFPIEKYNTEAGGLDLWVWYHTCLIHTLFIYIYIFSKFLWTLLRYLYNIHLSLLRIFWCSGGWQRRSLRSQFRFTKGRSSKRASVLVSWVGVKKKR